MERIKNKFDITNSFAVAISTFSNPFLILFITFIFPNINYLKNDLSNFVIFLIISILFPFIYYIYKVSKHKKHMFHFIALPREERSNLYLFSIFCFVFTTALFLSLQDRFLSIISTLLVLFVSFNFVVNKYIDKVSVHAGAYSLFVLYFADKVNISFAFLFITLPLIYWSRIKLHKHDWLQLLLGSIIGMVVGLASWTIR